MAFKRTAEMYENIKLYTITNQLLKVSLIWSEVKYDIDSMDINTTHLSINCENWEKYSSKRRGNIKQCIETIIRTSFKRQMELDQHEAQCNS